MAPIRNPETSRCEDAAVWDAVVGGLITSVGVVVGVYLTHLLTKRQAIRDRFQELIAVIVHETTSVASSLLRHKFDGFSESVDRLLDSLLEAQVVGLQLGGRYADCGRTMQLLSTLIPAAAARSDAGTFNEADYAALVQPAIDLNLEFRPTHSKEDLIKQDGLANLVHYIQNGLGAPVPPGSSLTKG